ncbi:MAG: (Fe-S)-binding protein [Deltaproteobacteria bacterium]|nr:(Fe-S)-binding protein [Deltaproteobacteria bacterium]
MAMDDHARDLEYCTFCPKLCRHLCPVSNAIGNEGLIPQAKMQLLNMLRRNAIGWQPGYASPLFACTGCGLCTEHCEHGNDVVGALWDGRAVAREQGIEHPALERFPERFRERGEALRETLHQSPLGARISSEARIGFLPAFDTLDAYPSSIEDAFFVFDALGMDYIRLVDSAPLCGGYQLLAAGYPDAARLAAEEMIRVIRRYATVVLESAACVYLLREVLPKQGIECNTEVLHLSEYLAPHAERLPIKRRRFAAYYHDPCYLGRYLKIYDPPRRLLARCVDSPREFLHHREHGECCGGGGLVPQTYPDATASQARRRLEEPQLFSVGLVVTACPTCRRTFSAAHGPGEVLDLINLIAWAIKTDGSPPSGQETSQR